MNRAALSRAELAEILSTCPSDRPQRLPLTDFHEWLAEYLEQSNSRLARKVLRLDRRQLQGLARIIELIDEISEPASTVATLTDPASAVDTATLPSLDQASTPTALPPKAPGPAPRPSRRNPRPGTRATCRAMSAIPGLDLPAVLLNVSPTGVGLVVSEPLCDGQIVSVTLQGPGDSRPLRRTGSVRWWAVASGARFRVGIQFQEVISRTDFDAISDLGQPMPEAVPERRRA